MFVFTFIAMVTVQDVSRRRRLPFSWKFWPFHRGYHEEPDTATTYQQQKIKRLLCSGCKLAKSHRYKEAYEKFSEAARKDATHGTIQLNCGNALLQLDKEREAIPFLRKAAVLEPTKHNWDCHWNLGLALHRLGSKAEALLAFENMKKCAGGRLRTENLQKCREEGYKL